MRWRQKKRRLCALQMAVRSRWMAWSARRRKFWETVEIAGFKRRDAEKVRCGRFGDRPKSAQRRRQLARSTDRCEVCASRLRNANPCPYCGNDLIPF